MFSVTFKALVTILLSQSKLYVVLTRGKGPKNSIHRNLFKTKNPKQKPHRVPAVFYVTYGAWIGLQPN